MNTISSAETILLAKAHTPPYLAVTPAGKNRRTEARYFDGHWLQGDVVRRNFMVKFDKKNSLRLRASVATIRYVISTPPYKEIVARIEEEQKL